MNQKNALTDQCIALAGMAQSVRVVQHIAWKGDANPTDFKAVLASLLRIEAPSSAAVYAGSFEVSTGLRLLLAQLDPQHKDKDPEFVNLMINVIAIQKKLENNPQLMSKLADGVQSLSNQHSQLEFYLDDEQFEKLLTESSQVYQDTLSKLNTRIQVRGEPRYLKEKLNQTKVRAALLCAVRACFLWRQCGGSRWHFLFKKKDLLKGFRALLANPIKE
ncbi:high frequency lysogenization protein HflD [Aliikangiella sp. IMCC44653]